MSHDVVHRDECFVGFVDGNEERIEFRLQIITLKFQHSVLKSENLEFRSESPCARGSPRGGSHPCVISRVGLDHLAL